MYLVEYMIEYVIGIYIFGSIYFINKNNIYYKIKNNIINDLNNELLEQKDEIIKINIFCEKLLLPSIIQNNNNIITYNINNYHNISCFIVIIEFIIFIINISFHLQKDDKYKMFIIVFNIINILILFINISIIFMISSHNDKKETEINKCREYINKYYYEIYKTKDEIDIIFKKNLMSIINNENDNILINNSIDEYILNYSYLYNSNQNKNKLINDIKNELIKNKKEELTEIMNINLINCINYNDITNDIINIELDEFNKNFEDYKKILKIKLWKH
jgi:hypothetical protein